MSRRAIVFRMAGWGSGPVSGSGKIAYVSGGGSSRAGLAGILAVLSGQPAISDVPEPGADPDSIRRNQTTTPDERDGISQNSATDEEAADASRAGAGRAA